MLAVPSPAPAGRRDGAAAPRRDFSIVRLLKKAPLGCSGLVHPAVISEGGRTKPVVPRCVHAGNAGMQDLTPAVVSAGMGSSILLVSPLEASFPLSLPSNHPNSRSPAHSCSRLALSGLQAAPKAGSALDIGMDNHGCRQEQQSHEQMLAESDPAAVPGLHPALGHQVPAHCPLPANPKMPGEVPATGLG